MKKEVKLIVQSIKEKNIRNFLSTLNLLNKEDIESVDEHTGFNIIHCCAQANAAKELLLITSYIKDINLNLKSKGIVQKTALDMAFAMGNKEVAKVLIQNGSQLSNPKEVKKTFKDDLKFLKIIDEALEKALPEKKKKGFFLFG